LETGRRAADDREKVLLRLACGATPNSFSSEDLSAAEAWSLGLNVRSGFERFMGWMVEIAFKLPLRGEVGDIRAYDLPERIGIMTMRSLLLTGKRMGPVWTMDTDGQVVSTALGTARSLHKTTISRSIVCLTQVIPL